MILVSRKLSFGFAQIPVILGLALMAVTLPLLNKLVSQNQENRGRATGESCYINGSSSGCPAEHVCQNYQCVCAGASCGACVPNCDAAANTCIGEKTRNSCNTGDCPGLKDCSVQTGQPTPTTVVCQNTDCGNNTCSGSQCWDTCGGVHWGNKTCSDTPECTGSSTTCDGNAVKVCSNGHWGAPVQCLNGQQCNASTGRCDAVQPPATNTPTPRPTQPLQQDMKCREDTHTSTCSLKSPGSSCQSPALNSGVCNAVWAGESAGADGFTWVNCDCGPVPTSGQSSCTGGKVWSDPDFTGVYSCNCPAGKVWSDPDFTGNYSCNSVTPTLTITSTPTPITTIRPTISPTAGAALPTSPSCLPAGYEAPDGDASLCCSQRVSGNTCLSGNPPTATPTPAVQRQGCYCPNRCTGDISSCDYYSVQPAGFVSCSTSICGGVAPTIQPTIPPNSPTRIPAPTAAVTGRPNTTPQPTSAPQPPPGGGNGTPGTGGSCGRSISIRMQSSASDPLTLNKAITVGQSLTLLCVKTGEALDQTDTRIVVTRPGANREEFAGPRKNNWTPTVAGAYTIFCEDLSCSNKQSVDTATVSVAASGSGACKTCPNDFKCYQSASYLKYGFFTSAYIPDGFERTPVPDTYCETYGGLTKPTWQGKTKGDANCDGVIGVQDTSIWRKEYAQSRLQTSISANWESDFNCDGRVDMTDYNNWKSSYVNMRRGQ